MIEAVDVEGFQSLDRVHIELGRFTVLVGPSNSGKSAIRRAIEALVHNDPPAGRVRTGSDGYRVALTAEGTVVSIAKGKKLTTYQVGELAIDKPGATCPPAVLEALRIDDVCFANQFDQPYLLADTPSVVARTLGELTNITVLFEGVREATRRQRAADKVTKTLDEQVDTLAAELVPYADLVETKAALDVAHAAMVEAHEADQTSFRLESAVVNAQKAQETVEAATAVLATMIDFDALEGLLEAARTTLNEAMAYTQAWARAGQLMGQIQTLEEARSKAVAEIDFETLEAAVVNAARWSAGVLTAAQLSSNLHAATLQLHPTPAESQAQLLLDRLTVCPLCEQPIEKVPA